MVLEYLVPPVISPSRRMLGKCLLKVPCTHNSGKLLSSTLSLRSSKSSWTSGIECPCAALTRSCAFSVRSSSRCLLQSRTICTTSSIVAPRLRISWDRSASDTWQNPSGLIARPTLVALCRSKVVSAFERCDIFLRAAFASVRTGQEGTRGVHTRGISHSGHHLSQMRSSVNSE